MGQMMGWEGFSLREDRMKGLAPLFLRGRMLKGIFFLWSVGGGEYDLVVIFFDNIFEEKYTNDFFFFRKLNGNILL
jgi:hypothetical protein